MADASANEPIILDYLNEDCWHIVLSYVPLTDIMRTEPVSRHWQKVVLTYLQGLRINIQCARRQRLHYYKDHRNTRCIMRWDIPGPSFKLWTNKLGRSVVAMYCQSEEILHIMSENCPNLEAVIFCDAVESFLQMVQRRTFKCLQKLTLDSSYYISSHYSHTTDHSVSQIVAGSALEELTIVRNVKITGECFANMELRNLKSLILHDCSALEFRHLLAATEHFNGLTKLELCGLPTGLLYDLPSLLANTPKLEHLEVLNYAQHSYHFCEIASRLHCLKKLVLHVLGVTDEGLDLVTRSCQELHSLDVCGSDFSKEMSIRAVEVIRRNAGARITELHFGNSHLRDDLVMAIVRSFPNLTLLDLTNCRWLTAELPARAAAARRELCSRTPDPLHLYVRGCENIECCQGMDFEELILHREPRIFNSFFAPTPFERGKWLW